MGRGVPLPNRLGGLEERRELPQAENEFGALHFVADRRTLITIRIIVSAVMDVETHTAKHEQQNVTMFTYTHHIQGHSFKR